MLIKEQVHITPYNLERTLHIYIPEGKGKFPVLYMFDGHNLFLDEEATFGKSWGMKKYLEEHETKMIVVGIECNHEGNERLAEFSPYSWYEDEWGYVEAKGKELIEWMVNELKPYIDSKYPTKTDRKSTYVGGSSMGGTMALYMALFYSHIYSKALCVSPHIYPMYKQFREDFLHPMHRNTTVYISWGGYEYPTHDLFARVTDQNLQIIRALLKKPGVDVIPHVFKHDDHSESAWEKELPVMMEDLNF